MPLRLVELNLPSVDLDRVRALLEDLEPIDSWQSGSAAGRALVRILVDAQGAESLSDRLTEAFGDRPGFRLTLLSVEATVPAVEAAPVPGGPGVADRPGPRRISREELVGDLAGASEVTTLYLITVVLSTVVAAVGLIRGDVAIIIGAMVIAPLLGPNIALPLACALGDLELAKRSLKAIAVGVGTAATLSSVLGMVLPFDPALPELAGRTHAGLGDVVLALAAGAAGSLAFTSGVPAVVVGVMVAVALLPPLVAAGLLAGAGSLEAATGALLLAATNVTCVNLAAIATFVLQRVKPRNWFDVRRARTSTWVAIAIWLALLLALLALMALEVRGTV